MPQSKSFMFFSEKKPLHPPSLLSMPLELICHILAFMDIQDLMHCTQTCKFLSNVITDSPRLQYAIELALCGMVPSHSTSNMSLATRRRLLHFRERAWRSLTWKSGRGTAAGLSNKPRALDLDPAGSVYEFAAGLYGNGRGEDERRGAGSISFFKLPSGSANVIEGADREGEEEMKTWTHSMAGLQIVDFTMDPLQDLLVLAARAPPESDFLYEIHLRTLSSNQPHPSASPPTALPSVCKQLSGGTVDTWASVRVQVAGDLLGLLVKEVLNEGVGAHLEIWNWRSGAASSAKRTITDGVDDFCFLSRSAFLLVVPQGAFEVYTFVDPATTPATTAPICTARYKFPPLAGENAYWYLSMSCNPAPGYVPSTAHSERVNVGVEPFPFYPRPDERILACSLYVSNPSRPFDNIDAFVLFVNIKTFLTGLPSIRRSANDDDKISEGDTDTHISWLDWGPLNTRIFNERLSTDWQHALYGYRTIETFIDTKVSTGRHRRLRVRDFNPVAVARARNHQYHYSLAKTKDSQNRECEIKEPEWHGMLITHPSVIMGDRGPVHATGSVFATDVITRLPYVQVMSDEVFEVTDVMMDECRVLLLKRGDTGGLAGIDVLTM